MYGRCSGSSIVHLRFVDVLSVQFLQQESIPVGCVLPAFVVPRGTMPLPVIFFPGEVWSQSREGLVLEGGGTTPAL